MWSIARNLTVVVVSILALSGRASADLIWGINGHPLVSYPGVRIEEQLDHVARLGMTSYRVDVSNKDQSERLKQLVAAGKQRGVSILPILIPPVDLAKQDPEQLYRLAFDFADFFVSRFKSDIRVWELGNELENFAIIQPCEMQDDGVQYNCNWGPAGGVGPLEYYGPRWKKVSAVLKGLSDATAEQDRSLRRAIGTAGWGHIGAFERMRRDGIEWDISVWHTYEDKLDWALPLVAAFGKPIWVTEFNNPYGSQKGVVLQARGLMKAMSDLRRLRFKHGVEAAHIYELLDETYWAPDFEAYMGLIYLRKDSKGSWMEDGPKPAHCIARTMIAGGFRMGAQGGPVNASMPAKPAVVGHRHCNLCMFDNRDTSPENLVAYSYCLALGRDADGGGLEAWSAVVRAGKTSLTDMLQAMLRTRVEALEKAVGRLSHHAFVTFSYQQLLDRDPDGQGLLDYVTALQAGTISRVELQASLFGSDEFKSLHDVLFRPRSTESKASAQ